MRLDASTSQAFRVPVLYTLAAIVISAATAFAYRGIEFNSFHFDDFHAIVLNASQHMEQFSIAGLIDAARGASLQHRPAASVTFAIDWWRGGGEAGAFLVTNLLIHIATAFAVLALITTATGRLPRRSNRSPATIIGVATAAMWWAVQPIQVQAVSYIVQRMTSMAALFTVLCVWAYIHARRADRKAWIWWLLSFLAIAVGAMSKPSAWIAPLLLLMAEFLIVRNHGPLIRNTIDRWLLMTPIVLAGLALIDLALDGPLSQWALRNYAWRDFTLAERLLTQPKVIFFHLSQIVWPLPSRFSIEHEIEIVRSVLAWEFWLPFSAIFIWCAWALRLALREGSREWAFFMLWVPATLVIESSVIPLEMVFEHRMYLPTMGLAGLIALGLMRCHEWHLPSAAIAWLMVAMAIGGAAWSTSARMPHWRSEIALYEQAVKTAPNSVRAWNQLGIEYLNVGRYDLAKHAIERANAIEPRWGDGYPFVNQGVLLEALGQPDRAREIYDETIRLFPNQVLGYNNRGLLSLRAENPDQALSYFDRAIRVDPDYAAAWTNRGTARYMRGNIESARQDFEQAIRLSPLESIAFHYLGKIYLDAGMTVEAHRARARACRLGVAQDCI